MTHIESLIVFVIGSIAFLIPGWWAYRRAPREISETGRIYPATFAAALLAYGIAASGVAVSAVLGLGVVAAANWVRGAGFVLAVLGAVIYVAARAQMRSFRLVWGLDTSRLLTTGVYARCRHPQVLGWGLLLTGAAVAAASTTAVLFALLFSAASARWLPIEETILARRFGETYGRYRAATPFMVPSLGSKRR
jgi:protein-S-isoprenylcysteine O-methyltransferase Ste14